MSEDGTTVGSVADAPDPWKDGDVDPVCAVRNPWMDEYAPNCCRFPKSCSPRIHEARAAALNECRAGQHRFVTERGRQVCEVCDLGSDG